MNVADVIVLLMMGAADICLLVHLRRRRARYIRMDRMSRALQIHIHTEVTDHPAPVRRKRLLSRVG